MSAREPVTPRRLPHVPVTDASESGRDAYEAGHPVSANPYIPGTPEHAAWWSAWLMQEEFDREFPEDPVEDLLAEVRATARQKEMGLDVLVDKIAERAERLANLLSMGAPQCVLDDARPHLRRAVDVLLEREPSRPGGA